MFADIIIFDFDRCNFKEKRMKYDDLTETPKILANLTGVISDAI
jgi:hypothetical protein